MPDGLRLAVGTLTRFRVPAPRQVTSATAATAMLIAPLVGAVIGLVLGVVAQVLRDHAASAMPSSLIAALTIGALAYVDRGLHLDGLADTADALGSARPAQEALAIARRSDIGPFGTTSIALVLLVQVLALSGLVDSGRVTLDLVIAIGTSRLALALACARGVPAARSDGLGAAVAGTVPRGASVIAVIVWTSACGGLALWLAPDQIVASLAAIIGALCAAIGVVAVCVRRLGGVTGDVLGASIEISLATALVILVAVPA